MTAVESTPQHPWEFTGFRAARNLLRISKMVDAQTALQDMFGDTYRPISYGNGYAGDHFPVTSVEVMSRVTVNKIIKRVAGSPLEEAMLKVSGHYGARKTVGAARSESVDVGVYRFKAVERTAGMQLVSLCAQAPEPLVVDRNKIAANLAGRWNYHLPDSEYGAFGVELPIGTTNDYTAAVEINELQYTAGAILTLGPLQFSR